jgi:hypothetical protein
MRLPSILLSVFYVPCIVLGLLCVPQVYAHQPVLNDSHIQLAWDSPPRVLYASSRPIGDPTFASLAIYGKLEQSKGVDMYVFMPQKTEDLSLEILVPATKNLRSFHPIAVLIGHNLENADAQPYPVNIKIPQLFHAVEIISQKGNNRPKFFEPYSLASYFHGVKQSVTVTEKSVYFIAVYDPDNQGGDYTLSLGDKENYTARARDMNPYAINANALSFDDTTQQVSDTGDAVLPVSTPTPTLAKKVGDMLLLWMELATFYAGQIKTLASL